MKRKLALLLSMTIAASLLAGCGSTNANSEKSDSLQVSGNAVSDVVSDDGTETVSSNVEDWPVVSFPFVPVYDTPDADQVEKALNDYLVSINAGVQADMVRIDFGSLSTTLTLMLSSKDDPIDLFSYQFFSDLSNVVQNEQAIPLDSYIAEYPGIVDAIGENYMILGKYQGIQYAAPVVGSHGTANYYALKRDIAEKIGVAGKDGSKITLEELDNIISEAKTSCPDYIYMPMTLDLITIQGYDTLADADAIGVLEGWGLDNTKIIDYYNSDDFTTLCKYAKKWADSGIFVSDPLNQAHDKSYMANGTAGGTLTNGNNINEARDDMLNNYNSDVVLFELTDLIATDSLSSGTGWCISSVSPHPEAAAKLLNLMYTDENVMRYIAMGIEGQHYVVGDDGIARFPEGKTASDVGWATGAGWYFPNQTLLIPFETNNKNYYSDVVDANNRALKSKAMGFIFDNTPVHDQYIAVDAVIKQYRDALIYGQVDVDSYLKEFRDALQEAGIDEIITEKQKQLDVFLDEN